MRNTADYLDTISELWITLARVPECLQGYSEWAFVKLIRWSTVLCSERHEVSEIAGNSGLLTRKRASLKKNLIRKALHITSEVGQETGMWRIKASQWKPLNCENGVMISSVPVFAVISLGSPRKLFIFTIRKCIYRIKLQKNKLI